MVCVRAGRVTAYLHELLLGAVGAHDVLPHHDEALADQRVLAVRADEAVVVPVPVLERDEASAADACNTGCENYDRLWAQHDNTTN